MTKREEPKLDHLNCSYNKRIVNSEYIYIYLYKYSAKSKLSVNDRVCMSMFFVKAMEQQSLPYAFHSTNHSKVSLTLLSRRATTTTLHQGLIL